VVGGGGGFEFSRVASRCSHSRVSVAQWTNVYQSVGQLLREFDSGMHEKLIQNATADVREAIRS